MSKEADIIAIIPARGGSKGVPRKNAKILGGKPLIAYTIEAALGSKYIGRVIVSTEDKVIAEIASEYGAEAIKRPPELAKDDSPTIDALRHVIRYLEEKEKVRPGIIVTLQPTSPLRTVADIDGALKKYLNIKASSLVSVCRTEHPVQWTYSLENEKLKPIFAKGKDIDRRQDAPEVYRLNGAIYINRREDILKQNNLTGEGTLGYIMPIERSVDIDTELDFQYAELLLKERTGIDTIRIGEKVVGKGQPCFIIAEAGVNHNGDVKLAKKLIVAAKKAGADAIKFQAFRAEKLVTPGAPKARYQKKTTSQEESQYEMLKKLELSAREFKELAIYAQKTGIIFLASAFDEDSADMLGELGVPAFKVGSGEITNYPLLRHIAGKEKTVLLATGMSTLEEVARALEVIRNEGLKEILLFHCVSQYPAPLESMNLKAMETMRESFGVPVGLSDHSLGITATLAAVARGACAIEKHFTLDKKLPGPDHKASLEPEEFRQMVGAIRNVEKALGDGIKKPADVEAENRKIVRRGIYARTGIKKGTTLTKGMLEIKRPAAGIEAEHLGIVIGRKAKKQIIKGSNLTWDLIEKGARQ